MTTVALKRSWRQIVRGKQGDGQNGKWPGFEVPTVVYDCRAVSTARHQSHWTIDPQCLKLTNPKTFRMDDTENQRTSRLL